MQSNTATKQTRDNPAAYDAYLVAFHEAFRPELTAAIQRFRTIRQGCVLDVPCGDGFYTAILAEYMTGGDLVAADLSREYLDRARVAVPPDSRSRVSFVEANAYHLPFADDSFDFVWCAQSMISLDDPVAALREMGRVLRPGGLVAVLETDEYHHVMLPWPVSLELAIQRAIRNSSRRRYGSGGKLAPARKLRSAFLEAGLTPLRKRTLTMDRESPFDSRTRAYLREHFAYLRRSIRDDLQPAEREVFDRYTSRESDESFYARPESELTCLATICRARKSITSP